MAINILKRINMNAISQSRLSHANIGPQTDVISTANTECFNFCTVTALGKRVKN
jgi:hypothetical protein